MQLFLSIIGLVFCLALPVVEGRRGPGGPKGPSILDLCVDSTDTKITCMRKAFTCGKELKDVFKDAAADVDLESLKTNFKECATELNIEFPEFPTRGGDGSGPGRRGNRPGPGGRGRKRGPGAGPGKIMNKLAEEIGADNVVLLKECVLGKQGMLTADGLIDREPLQENLKKAFLDDIPTQEALLDALDTCPEPTDFKVEELLNCIGTACIATVTI